VSVRLATPQACTFCSVLIRIRPFSRRQATQCSEQPAHVPSHRLGQTCRPFRLLLSTKHPSASIASAALVSVSSPFSYHARLCISFSALHLPPCCSFAHPFGQLAITDPRMTRELYYRPHARSLLTLARPRKRRPCICVAALWAWYINRDPCPS